ncbi:hypothetical protein BMETH_140811352018, partial [methanotrophic bacterial endosymbiont of Bathymodiolus sp.]
MIVFLCNSYIFLEQQQMSKDQLPPESQSDSDLVDDILEQMEDVNS